MWFKNNYVKMLVGAVARGKGVKIHLTLILETMHRKKKGNKCVERASRARFIEQELDSFPTI